MTILVLHGPNLNMLGTRDSKHYGTRTLDQINEDITATAHGQGVDTICFQSNHEGALIDEIQSHYGNINGILINPGALTHTSIALRDALMDCGVPVVEVHLSDPTSREEFRKISYIKDIAIATVSGLKALSYTRGLEILIQHILGHC